MGGGKAGCFVNSGIACLRFFRLTRVSRLCVVLSKNTMVAWSCLKMTDRPLGSPGVVHVCKVKRAMTLRSKGCTKSLVLVVSMIASCNTGLVTDSRYAVKKRRPCR